MSDQPKFAKREERAVVRKIITLIIVDFSDVVAVPVAANKRPEPTVCVVSDGRTRYVEAQNEGAHVKSNHGADHAEDPEGSHAVERDRRLTRHKISDRAS